MKGPTMRRLTWGSARRTAKWPTSTLRGTITRSMASAARARAADAIDLVIVPRSVDVGHFAVRRALPHVNRRMVGPFIFFDHFGPAEFHAGQGIDLRPHPHIRLAPVTFLFDGEIMHRDSLGTAAAIRPGEVNWMTAGRGIVHSERTAPDH